MKLDLSASLAVIQFRYINWRGEEHIYVIDVESIEFAPYGPATDVDDIKPQWVMNGHVVTRDGKPRGPTHHDRNKERQANRRTFLIEKMEDVVEVVE